MVWKSNIPLAEDDVRVLVGALGRLGPNTLLWVEPATQDLPAGRVERRGDRLLKAGIERLAPYADATNILYEPWFGICAEAYGLRHGTAERGAA